MVLELENLPEELICYIIKCFYTVDTYKHVSHAYALGVIRGVNHKFKNIVDELPYNIFYLTGKLALRFARDPAIRQGAISRFCKNGRQELPLHLDFYGVTITVTKAELLQSPVVRVKTVSLVGAYQSMKNLMVFHNSWPATHTIRDITNLSVDQSMDLVFGRKTLPNTTLPYCPVRVDFKGCCLRNANFYMLRNVYTVLMKDSTEVMPHQVSQLKNVRMLSLGSGFRDLECVRYLVHLRYLCFRNNPEITSIEPLHALTHLCYVDGYNTNVSDGAWNALKQVPRQQRLWTVYKLR